MLQKNPGLTAAQIEQILENTALPLPPGCRNVRVPVSGRGHWWSFRWTDIANISLFNRTICWNASPAGHGLAQADAALAATPLFPEEARRPPQQQRTSHNDFVSQFEPVAGGFLPTMNLACKTRNNPGVLSVRLKVARLQWIAVQLVYFV
jgi:hypothetical protein